jgi:hypothetical protein
LSLSLETLPKLLLRARRKAAAAAASGSGGGGAADRGELSPPPSPSLPSSSSSSDELSSMLLCWRCARACFAQMRACSLAVRPAAAAPANEGSGGGARALLVAPGARALPEGAAGRHDAFDSGEEDAARGRLAAAWREVKGARVKAARAAADMEAAPRASSSLEDMESTRARPAAADTAAAAFGAWSLSSLSE